MIAQRGLSPSDGVLIVRLFEPDRDTISWLSWPPHLDPLYAHHNPTGWDERRWRGYFQQELRRPDRLPFAVFYRSYRDASERLIGRLFLRDINAPMRTESRLGYELRPDLLGQGIGSVVLSRFLAEYFTTGGFAIMRLDVAAYNRRAVRCYEKCGFFQVEERLDPDHPVFRAVPPEELLCVPSFRPWLGWVENRAAIRVLEMVCTPSSLRLPLSPWDVEVSWPAATHTAPRSRSNVGLS
jgi:RimJ/RimL family protein N-acetyltransferase